MDILKEEKTLWEKGYENVVGLDESGRGSLAGPVIAAAVMFKNPKLKTPTAKKIQNLKCLKLFRFLNFDHLKSASGDLRFRDSKKLSSKQREVFYKIIIQCPYIEWAIGKVSEKLVDKINILEATKLAMIRAIKNLEKKIKNKNPKPVAKIGRRKKQSKVKIDFLIIDGNFKIGLDIPQKPVIKGDEKVFSCCLASIIAKFKRDVLMERYAKKFLQYGFEKNKGYATEYHLKVLRKYGFCKIHRKVFKPVKFSP